VTRCPRFSHSVPLLKYPQFSNSAALPIKLFLLEILCIQTFLNFFLAPKPRELHSSVFTSLFPGLKLMLALLLYQLLSLLFGTHSLNMSSNNIVSFRQYLKTHLFGLAYPTYVFTASDHFLKEFCIIPWLWDCPTPVLGELLISFLFEVL